MLDAGRGGERGHLFVISAPSGCGKTSLVRGLLQSTPALIAAVSHTTRQRRDGEVDGVDYHFVEPARFEAMVARDEFLEHATVFDHSYGTSRASVEGDLAAGTDVLLEIDWQGARSIRQAAPDAVSIFVLPPSIAELERRLTARGDSAENVARRMQDAVSEMSHYGEYDYLVVNDDFERALGGLAAIIAAARLRRPVQVARHRRLLNDLVADRQ
ncbi:MAG: guanylate kinase [Gammaproteobacteria bacterium]